MQPAAESTSGARRKHAALLRCGGQAMAGKVGVSSAKLRSRSAVSIDGREAAGGGISGGIRGYRRERGRLKVVSSGNFCE